MRRLTKALILSSLMIVLCSGCGDKAKLDPQIDKALLSMGQTLDSAKVLSFRAVGVMDEIAKTGQTVQFSRTSNVFIRRPDGLSVRSMGDDINRSAWYDGKTLTVLNNITNEYSSINAMDTIVETHDFIVEEYGLTMPLADFICGNTYETFKANVENATYVGLHKIDNRPCHHLAFEQEFIDWQIWIDAGDQAVPRKLVITYKQEPGNPTYVATMDQWNLSPKLSKDQFKAVLPDKAKRLDLDELAGIEE